ncbi:MAG: hypothetical protein JNM88_07440 [Chitinophagaceae bacterium]|nr:hypothetical protein [Chitinophagaceae bacterium]
MSKKKNQYKSNARKKNFLKGMNEELPTKGNVKNTVLETGKDLLVAVLGGGLIGSAIGRPSLAIGLVTTGTGHYTQNRLLTLLGIGMMAANGFQKGKAVNGLEGLDGVKERLMAYKENFSEKLYLDKIIKKKSAAAATNGIGELQYFNYNNDLSGGLNALESIENQLIESGMQFQQMTGAVMPEMEEDDQWEERLY